MTKAEAQQRAEKLREEINHHRYLYHVLDQQEISDAALDSLKKELQDLEQEYPELITPDSPTQRVSGQVLPEFEEVRHATRMLSLTDAFSKDDLLQWEKRNKKIVAADYEYFAELKVDGVALSLVYEDGVLVRGVTRGDGFVGENVTQNVKTIEAIPLALKDKLPGRVEVRGEVYMLKEDFERMNTERAAASKALFANPRNIAAGSIRQLDPALAAARPLKFYAWEITDGVDVKTRQEEYNRLQDLGFPVPPGANVFKNVEELYDYLKKEDEKRSKHPFQVDGVVIKINDLTLAQRLGVVGKAPRGSIAYKFAAEEATTIVEDIQVQVGRTGALTPVAHLKPVQVAGTTVSRATLHNADEVRRKDVRIGDTVIVRKAGDIIPEVVQVLPTLRPQGAKEFFMPKTCPVCGSAVEQVSGEVVVRCTNAMCFSQQREKILHAIGRQGFDIEGLGEKIVEQLIQEGLIEDVPDLWELQEGDLLPLERFAEKSAKKLIDEIQAHKKIPLSRFIVALGIPNVGIVTAQDLARTFHSLDRFASAIKEAIDEVEGVGPKVADSAYGFLQSTYAKQLLAKYKKIGIVVTPEKADGKLAGKTFVFTGSLGGMSRDEAKQRVQELGGRVASTVGQGVDFVVIGEDAGSKAKKAKELQLTIITPEKFRKLIAK